MRCYVLTLSAVLFLLNGLAAPAPAPAKKSTDIPNRLAVLDSIVQDAIHDGQIPGAVLLVWHNGQVVYRKALGSRSLEPRREPMTIDTIFDLASLTKVVATTTAVMQLVQKGELRVNDPVVKYIPEFGQNGKDDITIRQLLTHFSGLRDDIDLLPPWEGKETALRMAYAETPEYPRDRDSCTATPTSSCWVRWWSGFRGCRWSNTVRRTFLRLSP